MLRAPPMRSVKAGWGWLMSDFHSVLAKARHAVRKHLGQDVLINGTPRRVGWLVLEAAPMLGSLRQPLTETACLLHPDDVMGAVKGAIVEGVEGRFIVADIQPRTDGWWLLILRAQA